MEDEYIVMGLASYGVPVWGEEMYNWFLNVQSGEKTTVDRTWRHKMKSLDFPKQDVAASVQYFAEKVIMDQAKKARQYGSKLIWSGGVAQNIVAASKIRHLFDDMWIPVSPTDAGSALGVAAHYWCQDNNKDRINFEHAYLGHNIDKEINPKEVVDHLLEYRYCGIASGRAEFGPRALGNRSLIADVRYDVKDTVNEIKRRQKYRPFAPAILEEYADKYFEGPMNEYMQYQCKALHDYKSVTHVDGTARVQIVKKDCKSVFRQIIEEFYERTGVPMLLNTSLNIRGRPIVNDQSDAELFEKRYRVKVF
jgi:carbamoyltransferase